MIQFNLLPDVKLEYIKSRQTKRVVLVVASIAAVASLAILILMFMVVNVFQKKHLSDLNNDIKNDTAQLKKIDSLPKILTVQNQINSLTALHDKKPVASRLFGYLKQIVPSRVDISQLNIDFDNNKITFTGSADALSTVNTFVDTLKFTTYQVQGGSSSTTAFSDVVLSSFGRTDKGANYTINANFDHAIFDSANAVKLVVPNKITTRSETERPLFNAPPTSTTTGTGQ